MAPQFDQLATNQGRIQNLAPAVAPPVADIPGWFKATEYIPSATQFMGFTAWRGTNTILGGPWSRKKPFPMPIKTGDSVRARMRDAWTNTKSGGWARRGRFRYSPRSAIRFSHWERFDPNLGEVRWGGSGSAAHKTRVGVNKSMFQAGRMMNWAAVKFGENFGGKMPMYQGIARGAPLISGGFLPATMSGALIKRGAFTPSMASNVAQFIGVQNPAMYNRLGGGTWTTTRGGEPFFAKTIAGRVGESTWAGATLHEMGGLKTSQVLAMSGQGAWNQMAGGAIAASRGLIANDVAYAATGSIGRGFLGTVAGRGALWQMEGLAYGGFTAGERMGFRGFMSGMRAAYSAPVEAVERAGAKYAARAGVDATGKALADAAINRAGTAAAKVAGKEIAEGVGAKAIQWAGTKLAAKFALRAGVTGASGPAAPFVGAAMAAWTAYDLAKMGGTLVTEGTKMMVQTAQDGIRSLQGGINKAPMSGYNGWGYVDTAAAATSRARGVQAIQNSRLNARSVLGAEAPLMSQYFG